MLVESQAGINAHYTDRDYLKVGAEIVSRRDVWKADLVVSHCIACYDLIDADLFYFYDVVW